MKVIFTVAFNTFREIIRDRLLFGLAVFAVLLMGLSVVLGELSYAEQVRISVNFGLAGIQLSSMILSIFLGSTLVSREIEKQTVLTLLSRPVTRVQFVWGKFFGLALVNLVTVGLLALLLVLLVSYLRFSFDSTLIAALFGFCLESLVVLSATMLFGMFTKPTLAVCYTIGYALIGHWQRDLQYFAEKSGQASLKVARDISRFLVPDFEAFNWKANVVYSEAVPLSTVGMAFLNALGWVLVLIALSAFLFRRRDFV